MTLYAKILEPGGILLSWSRLKDSPAHKKADGWYVLDREPNLENGEYLEYDEQADRIVVKKIEKTAAQLEEGRLAMIRQKLAFELPYIILQNKDDPAALTQALCDRAKKIEMEITNETGRDTKAVDPEVS